MVTPIEASQELKKVVVPGSNPIKQPWVIYNEKYTWVLDPTTLVPIGIRVEKIIS
jgi:hypothetical protein